MRIHEKLKLTVRDIPDFPKPGILFKDITPILADPALVREVVKVIAEDFSSHQLDAVVGIESRGFIFGALLAQELNCSFVPVRKAGRLPYHTISESYELEYGKAVVEIHNDALKPGEKVLVHDDLLATGGTALAAARLVQRLGAEVTAFSFLINLSFLNGEHTLIQAFNTRPHCLVSY